MSSTFLYLAIVAVWAGVLVPTWLRHDTDTGGLSRLLHRRSGVAEPHTDDTTGDGRLIGGHDVSRPYDPAKGGDPATRYEEISGEEPGGPPPRRVRRAAMIARRRRRTFLLALTTSAATSVAVTGLVPWWVALPPVGLLIGHLVLLRAAAGIDAARQQRMAQARARIRRAEALAAERARLAEEALRAKIIDLAERARARDVFDQYAHDDMEQDNVEQDVPRAVGD